MPREVSRSPSYRRRHSPFLANHGRYNGVRKSRREQSRSPYSNRCDRSPSGIVCLLSHYLPLLIQSGNARVILLNPLL